MEDVKPEELIISLHWTTKRIYSEIPINNDAQ